MKRVDFNELAHRLADEGRLIEAGWERLRANAVPPNVSEHQLKDMHGLFWAGALHVFRNVVDKDDVKIDLGRIILMQDEVDAYLKELHAQLPPKGPT